MRADATTSGASRPFILLCPPILHSAAVSQFQHGFARAPAEVQIRRQGGAMKNLRALAFATVTVIVILGSGPASVTASARPGVNTAPAITVARQWPLSPPHLILRPFAAPLSRYSAGHRGIDLVAALHGDVFAASDGIVSFAGRVVDRPVVSIMHPGDLITTVEPVDALVAVGDRVRAGQLIGTVSAGEHCPPGCLHFGMRVHGLYVSPLLFLGNLPRAVLLPSLP